ncbi:MAG: asparagine synthase (glutamine-hydrolyzing) [Sulfurihydrogenibium sp.]|jgi:asparagine synthase (glutamine-hydrolysing)|nr:asparagine synthase (glutamine-hydrolyzing) [Sulfurihydrogenibium sp.]
MCGIAGIISKTKIEKESIKDIIERMNNTLIHRGPDGEGYYYGDNFVFAHRRLAIVDLSDAGKQPMEYMDRYIITYNGEMYNYIELKKELESYGYEFKSHTDTEVIMASYDFWGVECLNKFNGMWAFVLYDKKENKFFISRDRFGIKPLYFYKNDEIFIFASEIKAILMHPQVETRPNITFLESYLKLGCREYLKETAFENIYRFDFAHYFEGNIEDIFHNFKLNRYWDIKPNLSREKFDPKKAKEYAEKYYNLLEDAVRIRLRADVKIGSALSGGLDSSSVVYIINKLLKEQGKEELQETFSSVYKREDAEYCDESQFINIVAQKLNVKSNQIEPKEEDIPGEIEKMIWHLENPPENSLMSSWHTYKLISYTDVKVVLNGQGADELLAGYLSYLTFYLSSLTLTDLIKESLALLKIPRSLKYIIVGFLIGIYRLIFSNKGDKILIFIFKKILKKDFVPDLNKKLAEDIKTGLVTLLHYDDHTSMAYSIESRLPFMDYRVIEFLASVPACYKIHNGWTKYLARLAFDGKLPDDIVWRRDKMGWPIPEKTWFEGRLSKWFHDRINLCNICKTLGVSSIPKRFNKKVRMMILSVWEKKFLIKNRN